MGEHIEGMPQDYGLSSRHVYRYQCIDPSTDAKYVFFNAREAVDKVKQLGGGYFQYVPQDGEFVQIGLIDGRWQAFRFEQGPGRPKVPIEGETLEVIQRREATQALREIKQRNQGAAFGNVAKDDEAEQGRAYADAAAFRRIDDPLMREDAAVLMHESAKASEAYQAGLDRPPFMRTTQEVAQVLAGLDAAGLAKEVRKGTILGQRENVIEGVGRASAESPASDAPVPRPLDATAQPADLAATQHLIEGFDQRGKHYFFKGTDRKSFSDQGTRVTSRLEDRETIAGMLTCAEVKGWREIQVKGSESFRRQAWYAGRQRGLQVVGYEPTREEAALFQMAGAPESRSAPEQPLNSIEPAALSAGGGAAPKPLPAEAERAGLVGPARIEASLDEARKEIADAMGAQVQVFRAETRAGAYRGEVIAQTQMHVVQRISARMAVIHNKVDVAGGIIGQRGVYAYKGGRAQFAANREQQLMKAGLER